MYSLYLVRLNGYVLLYPHMCDRHKFELFTEFKTKNESTLLFGDVEPCQGSNVIAGDLNIHGSTVLKTCSRHTADDSIAGVQVLLGQPDLQKHGGWHAGYHSTGVNLACDLIGLTTHTF